MDIKTLSPKKVSEIKIVLLCTSFFAMLNETSINVALSGLMEVFKVDFPMIQWLVTGFMLVMAVIVPMTAFLIQSFRVRSIYFASLSLLTVGCLLAGFAPSFTILLIGRLIQAVGNCCLMLLTMNSVLLLSDRSDTGSAMGLVGLVALFAPAIAPSLAGIVLQWLGWRWIFLGPIVLFVIAGIAAFFLLENITTVSRKSLDVPSVLLEALGFGGVLYGICGLREFTRPAGIPHLVLLVVGIVSLAFFTARQFKLESPLLDLRVFSRGMYSVSIVGVFFSILTIFGINVVMPMFYVRALGLSTAAAGLAMLPGGIMNGLMSPVFGKLYDKSGPRAVAVTGMIALIAGTACFSFARSGQPILTFILVQVVCFVAISMVSTASQANCMGSVPPELYPHGSAIMSTLMQLGGGFGSALYAAFFAAGAGNSASGTASVFSGFRSAFLFGSLLLIIPFVASLFFRRPSSQEESRT